MATNNGSICQNGTLSVLFHSALEPTFDFLQLFYLLDVGASLEPLYMRVGMNAYILYIFKYGN